MDMFIADEGGGCRAPAFLTTLLLLPGTAIGPTVLSSRDPWGPGLAEEGAAELRKRGAQRGLSLTQGNIFLSSPG